MSANDIASASSSEDTLSTLSELSLKCAAAAREAADTGKPSEASRIARQAVEYASQASSALELALRSGTLSRGDADDAHTAVCSAWEDATSAVGSALRAAKMYRGVFRASSDSRV